MRFLMVVLLVIPLFFNEARSQDMIPAPKTIFAPQDFPPSCTSNSSSSDVWWTPLLVNHTVDPCSLLRHLPGQNHHNHGNHGGHHDRFHANPLQTYNVASACKACVLFPDNTTTPSPGALGIAPFQGGGASSEYNSLNGLPRWTNTSVDHNSIFNITGAVQVAISDNQSLPAPTRPDAGVIAGAVIGSFLFIAAVLVVLLFIRRRRLNARISPSAEFIAGAGPRATYNKYPMQSDRSLSPPIFEPGQWRDPVLEKAHGSAAAQRRFDNDFSQQV